MTEPDAGSTGPSPRPPDAGDGATGPATWDEWESDLVDAVLTLADGEALTITSGPGQERPVIVRRGFLRGFVPAKHDVLTPWVRLARLEDHVRGTCVGDERFGGPFPFSSEEDEALVEVGWRRPGTGDGTDYVRFWPDDVPQGPFLPRDEAERVAATVVRTFREVLAPPGPAAVAAAGAAAALPTVTRGPAPPLPGT